MEVGRGFGGGRLLGSPFFIYFSGFLVWVMWWSLSFRLGLVVGGGSEALWEKERMDGWVIVVVVNLG